jgi:hypothetical protein
MEKDYFGYNANNLVFGNLVPDTDIYNTNYFIIGGIKAFKNAGIYQTQNLSITDC